MRGKENMRRREEEDERKWDDKERDNGRNIEGNVERKEETRYSVIMKQKKNRVDQLYIITFIGKGNRTVAVHKSKQLSRSCSVSSRGRLVNHRPN